MKSRKSILVFIIVIAIVCITATVFIISIRMRDAVIQEVMVSTAPSATTTASAVPSISYTESLETDAPPEKEAKHVNAILSSEMEFINKEEFQLLLSLYQQLDFSTEFDSGNKNLYKELAKEFMPVLRSEKPYIDLKQAELPFRNGRSEYFVNELQHFDDYAPWLEEYIKKQHDYEYGFHIFDMNGDDNPEVIITASYLPTYFYIFEYDPKTKQFMMWFNGDVSYYRLIGSGKIIWSHFERQEFYWLDENAEPKIITSTFYDDSKDHVLCFFANIPDYINDDKEIQIPESMMKKMIPAQFGSAKYFRMTEKQYDEIMIKHDQARKSAEEKLKEIEYTYEEFLNLSQTKN